MKPTEFFKKWWKGVKDINPVQQTQIKITYMTGMLLGMMFIMVYICLTAMAYWIIFLFFYWLSLVYEYYITHKLYHRFKEEEKMFKEGQDRLNQITKEIEQNGR